MTGWQQVFSAYPVLGTIWNALCLIAPFAALLAFSGIFFMSPTAKILAIRRKRSAHEKFSRQIALLGLVLGWSLLIGGRVWLHYTQDMHKPGTLESYLLEMSWMLLSLGVLLSSVYYSLWRALKNMPILHATIGMISAAQNFIALIAILASARLLAAAAQPETASMTLSAIFPASWDAPLWSATCYVLIMFFAMPAAFSAVWLPMRRKHDDFGRDYYNSMLAWCAAWARNAWCALWFLLAAFTCLRMWQNMEHGAFNEQEAIIEGSRLLLWLIPLLLWIIVHRSKIPLRLKWLLLIAMLISASFTLPLYLEITMF